VAEVIETKATVGGGSLPGETLPSAGLALSTSSPHALLGALRTNGEPAVIGRIERGRLILDLRTVDPALDRALAARIAAAVAAA
jgi:L-seryl-tRNA(Ser) seleniumtransferase